VRAKLLVDKIADEAAGAVDPEQIDSAIVRQVAAGLRVRIAWKDITGQKYHYLDYVDPAKSPIQRLPFTPPGTYVPTAVEKNFTDIQRDVATVTSELAQVDYKGVAQDVRTLVATLQKKLDDLDVKKFGDAADAVRDLAKDPRIRPRRWRASRARSRSSRRRRRGSTSSSRGRRSRRRSTTPRPRPRR